MCSSNIHSKFINLTKQYIVFIILTLFEFKYLGPWRNFIINQYIKKSKSLHSPNKKFQLSQFSSIELPIPEEVSKNVTQYGYNLGGVLSDTAINSILNYYSTARESQDSGVVKDVIPSPHLDSKEINDILHSEAIYKVVKEYLGGVEPVLYNSTLWGHQDSIDTPANQCTREFHYDISDYKSIAMFIYLTDVDQHSAPHVIIKGTHKIPFHKRIRCKLMPTDKAFSSYSDDIITLTGKKGAIIFEDVLCYHKRSLGNKKRVILAANYNIRKEKKQHLSKTRKFILSLRQAPIQK